MVLERGYDAGVVNRVTMAFEREYNTCRVAEVTTPPERRPMHWMQLDTANTH